MAGESISIPILTPGADAAARNIKQVGNAAAETAGKLDIGAASLEAWNLAAAKSAKADQTLVASKRAHAKADALLADAENVLAGKATTTTKLFADQQKKMDDTAKTAVKAASGFSALAGGGGAAGGGMGALIGAGVALSPVLLTLGAGLGGLGLAALAAGKRSKQLATEIAPLKAQFASFGKDLQPILLSDFAKAAALAGHVLNDIEPVTVATGKALGGLFAQVDAEFKSGTWQQFFGFMARTAAPDMQLLGKNLTDLLQVIPPLAEDLQPLATGLLRVSDGAALAAGGVVKFYDSFQKNVPVSNQHTLSFLQQLDRLTVDITNHVPGARAVNNWITSLQHTLTGTAAPAAKAAASIHLVADAATRAAAAAAIDNQIYAQEAKALNILAAGYVHALGPLETYIGATIAERTDLVTLNQDLKKSHDVIGLKTAAERASFTDTQTFINQTIQTGNAALAAHKGIQGQINVIEAALPRLEAVKGKTAAYRQELQDLKSILDKLRAEKLISERVQVTGSGSWHLANITTTGPQGSGVGRAAGGMITGGSPGRDSVPIMAMPGEVVVPTGMVRSGAVDHLRGSLPGFAAGGVVGSYRGPVAGLPPWTSHNQQATINAIGTGIARALASAFAGAVGGSGHPLSGAGIFSQPALESLWVGAGGPGSLAHLMAAIADAESGGNPNAFNPSGASGLWQILGQIVPGNIFNPLVNAENAVAKWRTQGLGAWVTYTSGAYKQYYDQGGWLMPGATLAINRTGRPEQVVPARGGGGAGGQIVNVYVTVGHGTNPVQAARELAELLNAGARAGVRLRRSILSANG